MVVCRSLRTQVAPQTCALRLEVEVDHSGTPASVRHSVWKRRMRSFSYADRVGVALERCPGIPSFGRWRAHVEGILAFVRAAATNEDDETNHAARIHGQRRLHQLPTGGVAACEQLPFSRERIARRRASEAGARASTSRHSYRSTRLVGAGRAGPIRSARDALGEQPGVESGGLHRVPPRVPRPDHRRSL